MAVTINEIATGGVEGAGIGVAGAGVLVPGPTGPTGSGLGWVNVKDYGATGNGSNDDTIAIQNAINAAFVSEYSNSTLFFPPGNYMVTAPLNFVGVRGSHILGSGSVTTRIFFTGPFNGNSYAPATGGANAITPVIMTDGLSYSVIEGFTLTIADNNSAGIYLYQSLTYGPTQANTFINIIVETATAGYLIGYEANGNCAEQVFISCFASACATYGWRNISGNALNNNLYNCSAASCGIAVSVPGGYMNVYGGSLANSVVCDIQTGQNPMTVMATRTESANFIDMSSGSTGVMHTVIGCIQARGGGPGYFIQFSGSGLASNCNATVIGCNEESSTSTDGMIVGTGYLYQHSSSFFNASYLSSFTGVVLAYEPIFVPTVITLPTPSAAWQGIRLFVNDSKLSGATAGNYGADMSGQGSGGDTVPVWCDGTVWRLG